MFSVCLCLALTCAPSAFANPCARDIAALCRNVPAGEGIAACLRADELALSAACKQHLEEVQAQLQGMNPACEDDIALFCPGVQPGEGRVAQCLKANEARLSAMCKHAVMESVQ
jgi:hypothetical protein